MSQITESVASNADGDVRPKPAHPERPAPKVIHLELTRDGKPMDHPMAIHLGTGEIIQSTDNLSNDEVRTTKPRWPQEGCEASSHLQVRCRETEETLHLFYTKVPLFIPGYYDTQGGYGQLINGQGHPLHGVGTMSHKSAGDMVVTELRRWAIAQGENLRLGRNRTPAVTDEPPPKAAATPAVVRVEQPRLKH